MSVLARTGHVSTIYNGLYCCEWIFNSRAAATRSSSTDLTKPNCKAHCRKASKKQLPPEIVFTISIWFYCFHFQLTTQVVRFVPLSVWSSVGNLIWNSPFLIPQVNWEFLSGVWISLTSAVFSFIVISLPAGSRLQSSDFLILSTIHCRQYTACTRCLFPVGLYSWNQKYQNTIKQKPPMTIFQHAKDNLNKLNIHK